jgi:Pyruvate/2-oxoacid:ferredoxin oxidoreductase gamma subunit
MSEIIKKIKTFAKKIHVFKASHLGEEKFGGTIFGNMIILGAATGGGLLPLKEDSLREAIKVTVPREIERNFKAFELGLQLGREKRHAIEQKN